MRVGIAHHLGWAVAVVAAGRDVVARRRIELIEPGLPAAPVHHEGGTWELHRHGEPLDDDGLARLVAEVRAAAGRVTQAALDELAAAASEPVESISLRTWPRDFPTDIARLRRPPFESRADSVMYLQVLAEAAASRGWSIHLYDPATIEDRAAALLGDDARAVLHGPRAALGAPWTKDHRIALAATIVAGAEPVGGRPPQ